MSSTISNPGRQAYQGYDVRCIWYGSRISSVEDTRTYGSATRIDNDGWHTFRGDAVEDYANTAIAALITTFDGRGCVLIVGGDNLHLERCIQSAIDYHAAYYAHVPDPFYYWLPYLEDAIERAQISMPDGHWRQLNVGPGVMCEFFPLEEAITAVVTHCMRNKPTHITQRGDMTYPEEARDEAMKAIPKDEVFHIEGQQFEPATRNDAIQSGADDDSWMMAL